MIRDWDLYVLVHENEEKGPLCEYPKSDGVCRVYFFWTEVGSGKLPPERHFESKFPTKWLRVKDSKSFMGLFT